MAFRDKHPILAGIGRRLGGIAVDAVQTRFPLVGDVIEKILDAKPGVTDEKIAEEAAAILTNQSNAEPKTESRVVMGNAAAVLAAFGTFFTGLAAQLGTLGPEWQFGNWSDPQAWVGLFSLLFGAGGLLANIYALFGRLRDDLPPMHFKWWNPLSWLARRKAEVLADPTGAAA